MPIDNNIKPFAELTVTELESRLRQGEIHGEWPEGWWHDRRVFAAHHAIWRGAIANTPPFPDHFTGRGIVVCGGGSCFPCAYVCLRLLRHFGCKLPVELWHLGPMEINSVMRRIAERWSVQYVDALEVSKRHPIRTLRGWEFKPFWILHSQFQPSRSGKIHHRKACTLKCASSNSPRRAKPGLPDTARRRSIKQAPARTPAKPCIDPDRFTSDRPAPNVPRLLGSTISSLERSFNFSTQSTH